MKISTGIDVLKITSILAFLQDEFSAGCIFTPQEWRYIHNGEERPEQRAAGIFCAKEAVLKALGVGFSSMPPLNIEVVHNEFGVPSIRFAGHDGVHPWEQVSVSISHAGEYAVAHAIILFTIDEKRNQLGRKEGRE